VALVRPARPAAGALAVSIPPSAERLLVELGVLQDLERAGVFRNGGNTIWWAGGPVRAEPFEGGRTGFHADRAGLEGVMTDVALGVGVSVHDLTARSAEAREGGWVVECAGETGDALGVRARWLLDATGRRGLLARREGREADRSTSTVAIIRRWMRARGFVGVDPTHTSVESYETGWAWSVPLDGETRCFAAMVDSTTPSLADADVDAALDRELDSAVHVGALRAGATPLERAWVCPASLYTARTFARSGLLLVGDAGSFIDPLSSFGVKKALASAWRAAVCVHTALTDAAMESAAVEFFDEHERRVYRAYRASSVEFFDACAEAYGTEYWSRRARAARAAAVPDSRPDHADPDALDADAIPASAARDALERIRVRPRLDAVKAPGVRVVDRPTVRGHRLELQPHLTSARAPRGLRWVRNVDLLRVVEVAPLHADVPDGWAAYNAGAPAVTLPDYLAALATAFAAGLLEHSAR